jgi:uncharacterized protein YkwD
MAPSVPRSRLGHLTVAAVATIALAAALLATSPVAAQSASSSSVAAIERRMAELANQSRAAVGARPVAVDVKFAAASRDWSCQMARTKNFAHDPNFAAGGALAEIIAARSGADGDVGAQLHQQFLDSSAHREILLNPAYTRVGIGVCVLNGYWVTERFGTGTAFAAPASTTPTPTTSPSTVRSTPHEHSVNDAAHPDDHRAGPAHATACRSGPPPAAQLRPGVAGRLGRDRRQASRIRSIALHRHLNHAASAAARLGPGTRRRARPTTWPPPPPPGASATLATPKDAVFVPSNHENLVSCLTALVMGLRRMAATTRAGAARPVSTVSHRQGRRAARLGGSRRPPAGPACRGR